MKISIGKKIQGKILIIQNQSSIFDVEYNIIECIYSGEHFYIYKAKDKNDNFVCLKTIRYRNEDKNLKEYILFRRRQLIEEHKFLSFISHPAFPEPLGMIIVENNTREDESIFKNLKEWKELKKEEPILIQEYFEGKNLEESISILKKFSLKKRIDIIKKVAKICSYVHKKGYVLQNIQPSHIIVNFSKEDNIYIKGLHHICALKNNKVSKTDISYKNIPEGYKPLEIYDDTLSYDYRIDIYHLGLLFYYLITLKSPLDNPLFTIRKNKEVKVNINKENELNKILTKLEPSAIWLKNLMLKLLHPIPGFRLPNISIFLNYLQEPPVQDKLDFQIINTQYPIIKIRVSDYPFNTTYFKIRLEICGTGEIIEKIKQISDIIKIELYKYGKIICSICAFNREHKALTLWESLQIDFIPDIHLQLLEFLDLDKIGFIWEKIEGLQFVNFKALIKEGTEIKEIDLGNYEEDKKEVFLPPPDIKLPFEKDIEIICTGYFNIPYPIKYQLKKFNVKLYPKIPQPLYKFTPKNIEIEMILTSEQQKIYGDIELLHNDWPINVSYDEVLIDKDKKKIVYYINYDDLNIFEPHFFCFRVLIKNTSKWRTGRAIKIDVPPPSINNLNIYEIKGKIKAEWDYINHPQLKGYEIKCNGKVIKKCKEPLCDLELTPEDILKLKKEDIKIEIYGVYYNKDTILFSKPINYLINFEFIKDIFKKNFLYFVNPFEVKFKLNIEFIKKDKYSNKIYLIIEKDGKIINKEEINNNIEIIDNNIKIEKTYHYKIFIGDLNLIIFEDKIKIPKLEIEATPQYIGYEKVIWIIKISLDTVKYLENEIQIIRKNKNKKQKENKKILKWCEDEEIYFLEEQGLIPGETYEYYIITKIKNSNKTYTHKLGKITTQKFEIEPKIELASTRVFISWTPSPTEEIEGIEIYDRNNNFLGITKSDKITLENLEPDSEYKFYLKYKYPSGLTQEGKVIEFKTLPYTINVEILDIGTDSFKIKWRIPEVKIALRIKKFVLEVSEGIGSFTLSSDTRCVSLKRLYPDTIYKWRLFGIFENKKQAILLKEGEVKTKLPNIEIKVEIGLIHHIKWEYEPCLGISRVEIHRNNVLIIQTKEKELYDSDFKGEKEITYTFYYILKNRNKKFAKEVKVTPLKIKDIFKVLEIYPDIGSIEWNFTKLKKFKYLKYIELYRDNKLIYKQGGHVEELKYKDQGDYDENKNEFIGLPYKELNYTLAVVGVAPIVRKCKKKWTLNLKGLMCDYEEFPPNFIAFKEISCIFFEWERAYTIPFLEKIIIKRDDGTIIYETRKEKDLLKERQIIKDDDEGEGIEEDRIYLYEIEMIYKNQRIITEIDIDYKIWKDRLGIKVYKEDRRLRIEWNKTLIPSKETSIEEIGCKYKTKLIFNKTYYKTKWVRYTKGKLEIPILTQDNDYKILIKDEYGYIEELEI